MSDVVHQPKSDPPPSLEETGIRLDRTALHVLRNFYRIEMERSYEWWQVISDADDLRFSLDPVFNKRRRGIETDLELDPELANQLEGFEVFAKSDGAWFLAANPDAEWDEEADKPLEGAALAEKLAERTAYVSAALTLLKGKWKRRLAEIRAERTARAAAAEEKERQQQLETSGEKEGWPGLH